MRTNRPFALLVAGMTGVGLFSIAANAEPVALQAEQTAAMTSSFTLDFGGFGRSEASISHTQFELNLDPDGGLARFDAYDQDIAPLDLPGGFNTGNIRVEIVPGSSAGTFDPLTREFETQEYYAIYFEGDLSAFGLVSPVYLPSASRGTLSVSAAAGGRVELDWSGVGQLPNPFDPTSSILFNYTCSMQAAFASDPAALVNLALIPNVLNLNLPNIVESKLMTKLNRAAASIDGGSYRGAILPLMAFIQLVEAERGASLSDAEADSLQGDAQGAIDKLRGGSDPTHGN